jgi:hypothetical protein
MVSFEHSVSRDNSETAHIDANWTKEHEAAEQLYGLKVAFIDDNLIQIRNAKGQMVGFEFPIGSTSLHDYDNFIEQMQDHTRPMPRIETIRMAILKSPTMPMSPEGAADQTTNSRVQEYTWEQHARDHSMSMHEIRAMYFFAREELYTRFRLRLRKAAERDRQAHPSKV